jgi:hypothetical protein
MGQVGSGFETGGWAMNRNVMLLLVVAGLLCAGLVGFVVGAEFKEVRTKRAEESRDVADGTRNGKTEIKGDTKTDVNTKVSLLDLSLLSPRVSSTKSSDEQNKLFRDMIEARDKELKRLRKLLIKAGIDPD